MTAAKRRLVTLAMAGAALGILAFLAKSRRPPHPDVSTTATVEKPSPPYHERLWFPNVDQQTPPSPPPTTPPARPAPSPPPQIADVPRPAAPPLTGSQWITGYRDAICSCKTRSCVRDLQGRFVNALGSVDYAQERDQQRYVEASREAIRCYAALPEDS